MLNVVTENPRILDRQLVRKCLSGDPFAERAVYDAHVDRVYRLMHRMAGEADLAADFTQETFIRAFERLDLFRGDASLATWLHTIAVSVALNGVRKVNRIRGRTANIDDMPELSVQPKGFTADLKVRLYTAVDALSDKLRPVFVMHDVTSKARLFGAWARLRLALAAFAGDQFA